MYINIWFEFANTFIYYIYSYPYGCTTNVIYYKWPLNTIKSALFNAKIFLASVFGCVCVCGALRLRFFIYIVYSTTFYGFFYLVYDVVISFLQSPVAHNFAICPSKF